MFFYIIFQNGGGTGGDMLKIVRITAKQNPYRRMGSIHAYRLRKDTGKWGKIAVHSRMDTEERFIFYIKYINHELPIIENADFIVKNKLPSSIFNRPLPRLQPTGRRKFHSLLNGGRSADGRLAGHPHSVPESEPISGARFVKFALPLIGTGRACRGRRRPPFSWWAGVRPHGSAAHRRHQGSATFLFGRANPSTR